MGIEISPLMLFFLLLGILAITAVVVLSLTLVSRFFRRREAPGLGYIIACESEGLYAQADLAHAHQYLHLLYQKGVPASRVRAFLCPGDAHSGRPSPRFGLPTLGLPSGYTKCRGSVNFVSGDMAGHVGRAMREFAVNPLITRIVLIYLNHGTAKCQKGDDPTSITVSDMRLYCNIAAKPFLVILDASYSTLFAEKTIRHLGRAHSQNPVDVGFLTSGRGPCFHSAVLLSSSTPELFPSHNGIRCQVNHSMFSRAVLLDLAHKFTNRYWTSLRVFAAELNVPGEEMKNGFEAAYQAFGPTMHGEAAVFFPWVPSGPDEMSRVNPAIPFTSVIPAQELGEFCDDIGTFWTGQESHLAYAYSFCDIVCHDGAVGEGQRGQLSKSDPLHLAILAELKKSCMSPWAPNPSTTPKPTQVPYSILCCVIAAWLQDSLGGLILTDEDYTLLREMHDFLVNLNGKPPYEERPHLERLCELTFHIKQGDVRHMIVEARRQIAVLLRIPLGDDEANPS